jgi:hypothetical protein
MPLRADFAQSLASWIRRARFDLVRTNASAAMQNEIDDRPFKNGEAKNTPVTAADLLAAARATGRDVLDRLSSDIDLRTWASRFFDDLFKATDSSGLELDRLNVSFTPDGLRFDGRLVGNDSPGRVSDVQRALEQLGPASGCVTRNTVSSTYPFWVTFEVSSLMDDVVGVDVLKQMAEKLLARQEFALRRPLTGIAR